MFSIVVGSPRDPTPRVHATGCAAFKREARASGGCCMSGFSSVREAALEWWCDHVGEGSMSERVAIASVVVCSCARDLPQS